MNNDFDTVLDFYEKNYQTYVAFTDKIRDLIESLLKAKHFRVHLVTSRVKTKENLQRKINLLIPGKEIRNSINDICGIRIITLFQDEIDPIFHLIIHEFDIDLQQSTDKRSLLDPERFGYISIHLVGKLSPTYLQKSEYKHFANYIFEIQIRSIVQHAWAEIEHDLGYKSKFSVPTDIRRRFSQLAGTLELVDAQFSEIRKELTEYGEKVAKQIENSPEKILIDKESITVFVRNSVLIQEIESQMATLSQTKRVEEGEGLYPVLSDLLRKCNFNSISDVQSALQEFKKYIISYSFCISGAKYGFGIPFGASLIHLCSLMAIKNSIPEAFEIYGLEPHEAAVAERKLKQRAD